MSTIMKLCDHLIWADDAARDAIRTLLPGSQEHEDARIVYAHIAASEHVWLSRLEGNAPEHPLWPDLELPRASTLATDSAAALKELAGSLEPEDLERGLSYRNSAGKEFQNRMEDIVIHVAMHGAHHRGQIALLTRRGGGAPAYTDYIGFLRGAPAPTHERPRTP